MFVEGEVRREGRGEREGVSTDGYGREVLGEILRFWWVVRRDEDRNHVEELHNFSFHNTIHILAWTTPHPRCNPI
jgi:hypothetical protein